MAQICVCTFKDPISTTRINHHITALQLPLLLAIQLAASDAQPRSLHLFHWWLRARQMAVRQAHDARQARRLPPEVRLALDARMPVDGGALEVAVHLLVVHQFLLVGGVAVVRRQVVVVAARLDVEHVSRDRPLLARRCLAGRLALVAEPLAVGDFLCGSKQ